MTFLFGGNVAKYPGIVSKVPEYSAFYLLTLTMVRAIMHQVSYRELDLACAPNFMPPGTSGKETTL